MLLREHDNTFHVKLDQTEKNFQAALFYVKAIPGRKWNDQDKFWIVPRNGFISLQDFESKLLVAINSRHVVTNTAPLQSQELPDLPESVDQYLTKVLKKTLRPFQKKGVAYNLLHDGVLIGDQQGTGKTMQAIASVMARNEWPGLVITKNSLRMSWEEEWNAWTDMRTFLFTSSYKNSWPSLFHNNFYDVGIIGHDSLDTYFVKQILQPKNEPNLRLHHIHFYQWITMFKWIIIDESHYVKDMNTKRTKLCAGLTKGKSQVYLLSGTPLLNHPKEVYTQLCILNKQKPFGTPAQFKATYVGKKNRPNLKNLNLLLKEHCYYRRLKSEVAPELPSKTRQIILCDINNRKEYNKCENNFRAFLRDNKMLSEDAIDRKLRAAALVQMMELKKLAAFGKLETIREWMESMVDQEEKFILFGFHVEIQHKIRDMVKGMLHLGGGRRPDEISQIIKQFKDASPAEHPGCVLSISADSEGHNLQFCSVGGHVELPWHYPKAEQGEDRIHRIGTLNPVNWFYFLAEDTIDRWIYDIIMDKKEMHDLVTGTDEEIETKIQDRVLSMFINSNK